MATTNKQTFKDIINNSDIPVLVDFYADWCGPCKSMEPVISDIAHKMQGKAKVLKVNIDNNQQAANHYQVKGVPTFMIFKNGRIVWRTSGAVPEQQLTEAIENCQ